MQTSLTIGCHADVGRVRKHQEDAYGYKPVATSSDAERAKGQIFVVADGVGGQQAGEVASRLSVETILRQFYAAGAGPDEALRSALVAANQAVHAAAQASGREKMATTVVCAVIQGQELIVGHVGDSRAYLWHGDRLQQLTTDHSWIADQISAGVLSAEAAASHPYRNLITRSLGNKAEVEPGIRHFGPLANGDRIMLCTDGLYEGVSESSMAAILRTHTPQFACQELVRLANDAGGSDNITVMVLDVQLSPDADNGAQCQENNLPGGSVAAGAGSTGPTTTLPPGEPEVRADEPAGPALPAHEERFPPRTPAFPEALERIELRPAQALPAAPQPEGSPLVGEPLVQSAHPADARVIVPSHARLMYEWECELSWHFTRETKTTSIIDRQIKLADGSWIKCELIAPYEPALPHYPTEMGMRVSRGMERLVLRLLPEGYAAEPQPDHAGQVWEVCLDDSTTPKPVYFGATRVSVEVTQVEYLTKQKRQFKGLTLRVLIQMPVTADAADQLSPDSGGGHD